MVAAPVTTVQETIEDAAARVEAMNPVDRRMALNRFAFMSRDGGEDVGGYYSLRPLVDRMEGGDVAMLPDEIRLSDLALQQLLQKVGYPRKLLGRLPHVNVFQDVNHLIQHPEDGNKDRLSMLRLVNGDTARAVLGSQYTPLDDLDLLTIAADYLQGGIVRYQAFGPVSSHFTVTWEDQTDRDQELGIVRGLHIANSEVGMRSITIEGVIYRPVCSNVLIARGFGGGGMDDDGTQYIRRGSGAHNFGGGLKGQTSSGWRFIHRGDGNALRDFVRDAIEDTRGEYEALVARWKQGLTESVADATDAIERVQKAEKLSSDMLKDVLTAYGEERAESGRGWADSVTGIVNAFTRAAQQYEDPEARYQVQLAGRNAFVHLN